LGPLIGIWRFEKATHHLERSLQQLLKGAEKITLEPTKDEVIAVALLEKVVQDPSVPEADRLTASGILAPTGKQAIDFFERAVQLDPGHPYAFLYLLSMSFTTGNFDRTLALIEMWQQRNPRNPNPLLYRYFILNLQKRYDEADKTLQAFDLKPRELELKVDTLNAYRSLGKIARIINDYLDAGMADDFSARFQVLNVLMKEMPAAGKIGQTGVFRVPLTPAQRQDFTRFATVAGTVMALQTPVLKLVGFVKQMPFEKAMAEVDQGRGFTPEGLRLFMRATLQAYQIPQHMNRKEFRQAIQHGDAAVKDLEKALTEPCLFDLRRVFWMAIASYKGSVGKSDKNERLLHEARHCLRMAVGCGPISPAFAAQLQPLAEKAGDTLLVRDLERISANEKAKKMP
jgi:tetratricopeptide (TPR) repeat protein